MASQEIVASNITCPVCFEIFTQEIYQCENGHLVCGTCSCGNLPFCPQCRCSMRTKCRNRALEELISTGHINVDVIKNSNPVPNVPQEPDIVSAADLNTNTVFNKRCFKCHIRPITRIRLVCLFCPNVNLCLGCYKELKRVGNTHHGHSFALIQTKEEDEAFKELLNSENESFFTTDNFSEDLALSKTCSNCASSIQSGFVCLHCNTFYCCNYNISSGHRKSKKDHVFAVAYNKEELYSTQRHLGLWKNKQKHIVKAWLALAIGFHIALLIFYVCKRLISWVLI